MNLRSILVLALFAASTAQAQLKLPAEPKAAPASPNTPASPTAPMPPASDPVAEAKQEAAARVATDWLKLIDNAEYGKAWDECSALFREKVTRQQWVDGIPKNRADYGKFKVRKLDGTAYRKELPGAPDGDYVTVRFISDFEKNPAADELVTLVYQGGAWRPIGYLLR
jgi:Protein of unknown function (DUF4019)